MISSDEATAVLDAISVSWVSIYEPKRPTIHPWLQRVKPVKVTRADREFVDGIQQQVDSIFNSIHRPSSALTPSK